MSDMLFTYLLTYWVATYFLYLQTANLLQEVKWQTRSYQRKTMHYTR